MIQQYTSILKIFIILILISVFSGCSSNVYDSQRSIVHKEKYIVDVKNIDIKCSLSMIFNPDAQERKILKYINDKLVNYLKEAFQAKGTNGKLQVIIENINFDEKNNIDAKKKTFAAMLRLKFIITKENDSNENLDFTISAWNEKSITGKISQKELNNLIENQINNLIFLLQKEFDKKLTSILKRYIIKEKTISTNTQS